MVREILKYGAPELVQESGPIEMVDEQLRELAQDMLETMYDAPGDGLAAPQVGINRRLIVVDVTSGEEQGRSMVLVNPELVESNGVQKGEEGCLSIPGFTAVVQRPMNVKVKAMDLDGNTIEVDAEDLEARVLCHEIDHLDGVLYLDRISRLKKDLIKRKIRKLVKAGQW
jgi:peptide deformylase